MQAFFQEHSAGFHIVEPKKIWEEYTENYDRMDTYYRLFHKYYADSLNVYNSDLQDYGYILDVPRQENFYRYKVNTAKNRVFVIISDAFRYEVAASLTEQLRCKSAAKTEWLAVLADGQSTDSNNREKLLKQQNPASLVLKYKDVLLMKRSERGTLVKGKEVVYIYHDRVDHTSHNDETAVFGACNEAIDEIKNMVRIIINEWGSIHTYITAHHGFLYTYCPFSTIEVIIPTSIR